MKPTKNNTNYSIVRARYGSITEFCRQIGITEPTWWAYNFAPQRLSEKMKARIAVAIRNALEDVKEEFHGIYG